MLLTRLPVGMEAAGQFFSLVLCRRFELERSRVGPCSRGADLGEGGVLFYSPVSFGQLGQRHARSFPSGFTFLVNTSDLALVFVPDVGPGRLFGVLGKCTVGRGVSAPGPPRLATASSRNPPHVWLKSSSEVSQGLQSRTSSWRSQRSVCVSPRSTCSGWCL